MELEANEISGDDDFEDLIDQMYGKIDEEVRSKDGSIVESVEEY